MAHVPAPGVRPGPDDRPGLVGDAVHGLLHAAAVLRRQQDEAITALGLTPAAGRALRELDPDHPLPARDLAEQLGCDRSNVTGLADRLEQAGLVERRVDPVDRRQKTLVVTGRGRAVRDRVRQVMSDPRLLDGLSTPEVATLRELVEKITNREGPPEQAEV
ncbi:MarR family winged helix-turn-helix transcriptional regulator [Micromonospora sp. DT31]|uniref:MarR family winged helix-turn-helix transcriptional regulator n=1 Tax=Micromonospora sp. DT31 TaxID=3393434 RepID=UPI003CF8FFDB